MTSEKKACDQFPQCKYANSAINFLVGTDDISSKFPLPFSFHFPCCALSLPCAERTANLTKAGSDTAVPRSKNLWQEFSCPVHSKRKTKCNAHMTSQPTPVYRAAKFISSFYRFTNTSCLWYGDHADSHYCVFMRTFFFPWRNSP
jgi:hypothetical protein